MTTLAIGVLAFLVGWLLGKVRAYREVIEINTFIEQQQEQDSWAEAQRSVSPWQ